MVKNHHPSFIWIQRRGIALSLDHAAGYIKGAFRQFIKPWTVEERDHVIDLLENSDSDCENPADCHGEFFFFCSMGFIYE